jgi:hypothetical protein
MEKHNSGPERNHCQPRIVYPEKLSFLIEREMKTFDNKEKLTKSALQKILKGLFI